MKTYALSELLSDLVSKSAPGCAFTHTFPVKPADRASGGIAQIDAGFAPPPASSVLPRRHLNGSNPSFFPARACLMKCALVGVNSVRTTAARGAQQKSSTEKHMENHMKSNKQPAVRKPTKKIADSGRVRYGNGCAPAKLARSADRTIADSGAIRFGNGCAPASLRK